MGWPGKQASLPALALGGKYEAPKIHNVDLLGHKGKLKWRQDSAALTVELPEQKPSGHAVCFRVALA
jgi:alpha-L-fucosidase